MKNKKPQFALKSLTQRKRPQKLHACCRTWDFRNFRRFAMALNHRKPTPRNGNMYRSRSHRPKPGGVGTTCDHNSPPPIELASVSRTFQFSCWSNCASVLYSTCPCKSSTHAE